MHRCGGALQIIWKQFPDPVEMEAEARAYNPDWCADLQLRGRLLWSLNGFQNVFVSSSLLEKRQVLPAPGDALAAWRKKIAAR